MTIVRLRGQLLLYMSAATAAQDGFTGAVAVGIVRKQAFDIGVTAVPLPLDEEFWDGWMWYQYFSLKAADPIVAGAVSGEPNQVHNVSAGLRIEVDSKAMRKIPQNNALIVVIQALETGTAVLNWLFNSRTLSKLP